MGLGIAGREAKKQSRQRMAGRRQGLAQAQGWAQADAGAIAPVVLQAPSQACAIDGEWSRGGDHAQCYSGGQGSRRRSDMPGYAQAMMGVNPTKGTQPMQSLQKELPVDKINPEKFTPASLAKFAQTRNFGDLVPRDKLEFVEGVGVNPTIRPMPIAPFRTRTSRSPWTPAGISCPTAPIRTTKSARHRLVRREPMSTSMPVQKRFAERFRQETTDVFLERDAAQAAASTVQSIAQIRAAGIEARIRVRG